MCSPQGFFWHVVQATELNMIMEREKFTEVAWGHLTAAANLVIFDEGLSKKRTPVVSLQVERLSEGRFGGMLPAIYCHSLQSQSILSQLPGKPASEEAALRAPSGVLPATHWHCLCDTLQ